MENVEEKVVNNYDDPSLKKIEDERLEFFKTFKKHDLYKKIVFAVCFIAIIIGFIVVPAVWPDGGYPMLAIQYGVPIAAIAIMFVYATVIKRYMNKQMKAYFATYYKCSNEYVLVGNGLENVVLQEPGKIDLTRFIENDIYKNVFEVGSRGLTTFSYKNMEMSVVDCAAQIKGNKRVLPVFVGKYLEAESSYDSDEAIIIYFKGEGLVLPPTNVENRKIVLDTEKYVVYTNQKDWKKVLTSSVLKSFETIKTDKLLVDLTISLRNKKQFICMGYDDPLMIPPLQKPFKTHPTEQYKRDLAVLLKVVEGLK